MLLKLPPPPKKKDKIEFMEEREDNHISRQSLIVVDKLLFLFPILVVIIFAYINPCYRAKSYK